MAGARIISIIGRKNAGKTSLTVALAAEFGRRGKRVMTIKHGHHSADLDTKGTDSWRHFHEGRAERVLLAGPDGRVLFDRARDLYDPVALAREYLGGADIVLVEGFKRAPIPKIEVWRREVAPAPLYDPSSPDVARWVALVTDDESFQAPTCRVIHFRDTMWLHLLAPLAWDEALILEP
jgi:molybdopterin-guanine dinucleotide biosynthesis protein B